MTDTIINIVWIGLTIVFTVLLIHDGISNGFKYAHPMQKRFLWVIGFICGVSWYYIFTKGG